MKQNEPKKPIEVTLLKKHTHADRDYQPGDKIEVNEIEHDWLVKHGIIAAPAKSPGEPRAQS